MINLDFADVKSIMRDAGSALMAIGRGGGEDRCIDAAKAAISSPLLEMSIEGATGVLYNISGGGDLSIAEVSEAAEIIRAAADEDAEIIFGTTLDDSLGRDVSITLIATGFQGGRSSRQRPMADRRSQRPAPSTETGTTTPPRQRQPVMPDDEWSEPAILRFLRERQ
jgi:cell division protein FtsZ